MADRYMSKPRLTLKFGIWKCSNGRTMSGFGYTPALAYEDWKEWNKL